MTKTPVTFVTGVDLHLTVKAYGALSCSITRLARKCQRRGTDAAGVLPVRQGICDEAYGALSTDWYYLPGKNGHTIGITIRDTMKHTITRPQPAFR